MKNKKFYFLLLSFFIVLFISSYSLNAQIQTVYCYKSNGDPVNPGDSWTEFYNGVEYNCYCSEYGGSDCQPVESSSPSSSSSGSNYSGSSSSFESQLAESIVAPVIENFFNWLFSPSSDNSSESNNNSGGNTNTYTSPPISEEERLAKEKDAQWKETIQKLRDEQAKLYKDKFSDLQKTTADDFKNRIIKSEAIKNIKQLNCSAYQSIEAAKFIQMGEGDIADLEGPLENSRAFSDFTIQKVNECPEIKFEIPEVTVSNPVGFQQVFYQKVKLKADSLALNVAQLKEKEKSIKQTVEKKRRWLKN